MDRQTRADQSHLLGYIEGAPPLPSENLTVEDDYVGATKVSLTQTEETRYSWQRREISELRLQPGRLHRRRMAHRGGRSVFPSSISEGKAGLVFNYMAETLKTNESAVGASSSLEHQRQHPAHRPSRGASRLSRRRSRWCRRTSAMRW